MATKDLHAEPEQDMTIDRPIARPDPDPTLLTTKQLLREMSNLKELVFTRLDGMDRAIIVFHESITKVPTDTDKQIGNLKELVERTIGEKDATLITQFRERDQRMELVHKENSASIANVKEVIGTRIDGMDKAIELLQVSADRSPDFVQNLIQRLQDLHNERFHSIQVQFTERDTRTEQTSKDSKVAVDAALQAAKEAVGEQNKSSALAIAKSEAATTKQIDQIAVIISTTNKGVDDKIDDIKTRLTSIESRVSTGDGRVRGTDDSWKAMIGVVGVIVAVVAVIASVGVHFIK